MRREAAVAEARVGRREQPGRSAVSIAGHTVRARCEVRPGPQAGSEVDVLRLGGVQRARILSATVAVSCECGAANVSVARIVARSGISRRTFYEHFTDREDCVVAALEQALVLATERVRAAVVRGGGWQERLRAGLVAFLGFVDEEPRLGRLLVCESQAGGPRAVEIRNAVIARLTGVVDQGRRLSKAGGDLSPMTSEGLVGGALAVIQTRLIADSHGSLVSLVNPLMSMIVMPYLGKAAARRELDRPVASVTAVSSDSALPADPFKELGMRLTYRTVRVLAAIAEHPGASNRVIGDSAGIDDQGQASKLLGRLLRAGLIVNNGTGGRSGAPNAWELTPKGHQLADSIRPQVTTSGSGSRGVQGIEGATR